MVNRRRSGTDIMTSLRFISISLPTVIHIDVLISLFTFLIVHEIVHEIYLEQEAGSKSSFR